MIKKQKKSKSHLNKKAMGVGQVFVFIIAALSFALIMIFGYKMISGFIISGEKVEFAKFSSDLSSSVQKIYTEYGAVRVKDFRVPGSYNKICFVDMDWQATNEEIDELCAQDALACSVWQDAITPNPNNNNKPGGYAAIDQNVFLTPTALTPIKVYKISVVKAIEETADPEDTIPVGFICQEIKRGFFRLLLEGKGDKTQLQFTSITAEE